MALFFSRGGSLNEWCETGLIDREKLIYEEHLKAGHLSSVVWLTYGPGDDAIGVALKNGGRLDRRIEIAPMPALFSAMPLGIWLYSLALPFVHRKFIRTSQVLKTNQMDGSWSAVIAKKLYRVPLVVRTGYTISKFERTSPHSSTWRRLFWGIAERLAYRYCNHAFVSSEHDLSYLVKRYKSLIGKVEVLRNYVDTDRFRPMQTEKQTFGTCVFVGRLSAQKNLFSLVDAISELGASLDIYGKGELEEELRARVRKVGAKVNFKGTVANEELPEILNRYRVFVLPSLYEGMPKTLLEAMSCGLLCVGTDVEGINEVITDGGNGYLASDTSTSSIAKALRMALDEEQTSRIVSAARKLILEKYSLNAVCDQEFRTLACVSRV